jgi:uncharacterized Zn finger protein
VSDVRDWTSSAYFDRGRRYYERGAIRNPRRANHTLKAQCLGSRPTPYHVRIELGPSGIVSGDCSCPIGEGGRCKHAVALLLTWVHDADSFSQQSSLTKLLNQLDADVLVDIIQTVLERQPELEGLVVMRAQAASNTLTAEEARRQVRERVRSATQVYDYDTLQTLVDDLDTYLDLADQQLGDDPAQAGPLYAALADELCEHYDELYDEQGSLATLISRSCDGAAQAFSETDAPERRQALLRTLFEVYAWDVRQGGYGIGDAVPDQILAWATPDERRRVASWIRELLGAGSPSSWRRQALGGFLLALEADEMDDETYLERCRETGRLADLTGRLLELDRVDEAVTEARQAEDFDLLQLAARFEEHDAEGPILDEMEERMEHSHAADQFLRWMLNHADRHDDAERALDLAEQLLWLRPSAGGFARVKEYAQTLGRWDTVRSQLLDRLHQDDQHGVLTRIYLNEGDVAEALETLRQQRAEGTPSGPFWSARSVPALMVEVAEAAEEEHPREAIRLYRERAEALIDQRGRGNYAEAARYLQRVKALHEQLDEMEAWTTLIEEVRDQDPHLPAMTDEFNKAGL